MFTFQKCTLLCAESSLQAVSIVRVSHLCNPLFIILLLLCESSHLPLSVLPLSVQLILQLSLSVSELLQSFHIRLSSCPGTQWDHQHNCGKESLAVKTGPAYYSQIQLLR